jgi:hypothetical protein
MAPGPARPDSETMSWLRRSPTPPAHAVDGVEPTTSEGAYVHYTGRALQARPAVVGSLARLPNDEALEDLLSRPLR